MAKPYTYYYNAQIKGYIAQCLRIFTGLQVQYGVDRNANGINDFKIVNVHYGDMERVVAEVLYKDKVFQATSLPVISGVMTDLQMDTERRLSKNHRESIVRIREADGVKVAHERLMGIPMKLGMDISIYTSNNDQMMQIMEQVLMMFTPHIMIQKSEDIEDWSYITRVDLTNITNERNTPTGTDDRMIVQTLGISADMWLNFPEKQYNGIIEQITLNVLDNTNLIEGISMDSVVIP